MNIINYQSCGNKSFVFCIIDDVTTYHTAWTNEIIKNIADFTISNLFIKGYDIFVGQDEDQMLKFVADQDYQHAVIMSPGTEFVNGFVFFDQLQSLSKKDYFISGHVLDRGDAYYELHHQCYVVNLKHYKDLDYPEIGKHQLGCSHKQTEPVRSIENFHDDYTPLWISPGNSLEKYSHKCHGWNILSRAWDSDLKVLVFDQKIRQGKKHHYPESKKDFEKNLSWIYFRNQFCSEEYVHTSNNEWSNGIQGTFDQIALPASGTLYLDLISEGKIIFYDYNQKSLDYWETKCVKKTNIEYLFLKTNLLINDTLVDHLDCSASNTLINFSNIFCYEGTASMFPLPYRLSKENEIIRKLKTCLPESTINFTSRAASGFFDVKLTGKAKQFTTIDISHLKKPTWHYNQDWF